MWPVRTVCRVLGLSASGYYAWVRRCPSSRARRDRQLLDRITSIWRDNRQVYGRPRIHAELQADGERVGQKRVARLMKRAGIEGASRRRGTKTTTRDQRAARVAPDLVDRDFSAAGADQLWVADITYVSTWAGFLYLAVVLDAWSRPVVGWAMAAHLRTELVLDALNMAIWQRRPHGVVHHSDQGSQYTSVAFGARCKEAGVRPSTGSVGDAYDNALCESFFADPGVRVAGPQRLSQPRRSAHGDLRVRRRVLQSATAAFCVGLPVADRLRGQPRGGGIMSTGTSAIRAIHGAGRGHSVPIRDLRADRRPNEAHSGSLRPLRTVGGILGYPVNRPFMAGGGGGPARRWPAAQAAPDPPSAACQRLAVSPHCAPIARRPCAIQRRRPDRRGAVPIDRLRGAVRTHRRQTVHRLGGPCV